MPDQFKTPKQVEIENTCADMGRLVNQIIRNKVEPILGRKIGFTILMFDFGGTAPDQEYMTYMSNADRDGMIEAMKEFIEKSEAGIF